MRNVIEISKIYYFILDEMYKHHLSKSTKKFKLSRDKLYNFIKVISPIRYSEDYSDTTIDKIVDTILDDCSEFKYDDKNDIMDFDLNISMSRYYMRSDEDLIESHKDDPIEHSCYDITITDEFIIFLLIKKNTINNENIIIVKDYQRYDQF